MEEKEGKGWWISAGYGFLGNPEPLHPGDVQRVTASALWSQPIRDGSVSLGFLEFVENS